jgi:hypothetical protein
MTHPKRPRDPNQLAKSIIDIATGQKPDRDPTPEEQGKRSAALENGSKGARCGPRCYLPMSDRRLPGRPRRLDGEPRLRRERKSINSGRVN